MNWGKSFCIITGASRGIGQCVAIEFAKKFGKESLMLLMARTESGLKETKQLVRQVTTKFNVEPVPIDLQKAGNMDYKNAIEKNLKKVSKRPSDFDRAILIHDAGAYSKNFASELDDMKAIQEDLALNFISPILLNTQFFKIFDKSVKNRHVVQVTSCISQMPVPRMGMYGSIKAARNHFFLSLALENPTIKVLNYDPGVVQTEMLRKSTKEDGSTMDQAMKNFESIGLPIITPEKTAQVLVEYLESEFTSGALLNVYRKPNLYKDSKKIMELAMKVQQEKAVKK